MARSLPEAHTAASIQWLVEVFQPNRDIWAPEYPACTFSQ